MRRYCLCWLVLKRNDELSLFFSGFLIAKQTTNLHWFSLCLPTRMTLKGFVLQLSGPKALATFGNMPFLVSWNDWTYSIQLYNMTPFTTFLLFIFYSNFLNIAFSFNSIQFTLENVRRRLFCCSAATLCPNSAQPASIGATLPSFPPFFTHSFSSFSSTPAILCSLPFFLLVLPFLPPLIVAHPFCMTRFTSF